MEALEQPKAVQEATRKAVREAEDRADTRLKTVHEAYEKAAAEQQMQIKELLRESATRAKAQQEQAVAKAIAAAEAKAAEERQQTLDHARQAVQVSASATAEQMDAVLAELAELRAENLRLAAELEAARLTAELTTGNELPFHDPVDQDDNATILDSSSGAFHLAASTAGEGGKVEAGEQEAASQGVSLDVDEDESMADDGASMASTEAYRTAGQRVLAFD